MRSNQPSLKAGIGTANPMGEARRTQSDRDEHRVAAQEGKGKSTFAQALVANDGSRSQRSAREVYQSERRQAEDTIQRQDVPVSYSQYLRRYFNGIDPETPHGNR